MVTLWDARRVLSDSPSYSPRRPIVNEVEQRPDHRRGRLGAGYPTATPSPSSATSTAGSIDLGVSPGIAIPRLAFLTFS